MAALGSTRQDGVVAGRPPSALEHALESAAARRARGTRHHWLMRAIALALALGALLALPSGCAALTPLPVDHSTALVTASRSPYASNSPIDDEATSDSAHGVVAVVTPIKSEGGVTEVNVEVAGAGPTEQRSFRMALPTEIPLPFAVGDEIVLEIATEPGPPSWLPLNAAITRVDGVLLAMSGVRAPEGWRVHPEGEAREGCRAARLASTARQTTPAGAVVAAARRRRSNQAAAGHMVRTFAAGAEPSRRAGTALCASAAPAPPRRHRRVRIRRVVTNGGNDPRKAQRLGLPQNAVADGFYPLPRTRRPSLRAGSGRRGFR